MRSAIRHKATKETYELMHIFQHVCSVVLVIQSDIYMLALHHLLLLCLCMSFLTSPLVFHLFVFKISSWFSNTWLVRCVKPKEMSSRGKEDFHYIHLGEERGTAKRKMKG